MEFQIVSTHFHFICFDIVSGGTTTPPAITGKKKLEECQEFDKTIMDAQFAFRSTDLQIWKKHFASRNDSDFTDLDPVITQHWSTVVYFPQGNGQTGQTLFFEAVEDKMNEEDNRGHLQVLCAENVDAEVFKRAKYFDTLKISPNELLEKAKQVSSNGTVYDGLHNNCQSWVKEFLGRISPQLLNSLIETLSSAGSTRNMNDFLTNVMQLSTNSVKVTKLDECEEEFDQTKRDAQFALKITEPCKPSPSSTGEEDAGSDPTTIQHWALLVHFSRGNKTYLYQAWKDESSGLLQAGRAENVDHKVFQEATSFGAIETCPSELLAKAKQVSTGEYNATNDDKSWLREFLAIISPELLNSLIEKLSSIA
jgi:hypothetical protein